MTARAVALVGVLLVVVSPARADGTCDLSTDDGVRAAYLEISGVALSADHPCIARPSTFPGVVRVGSFAYDRGCGWRDVLVACHGGATSTEILATGGWDQADADRRAALARAYLEELVGQDILDDDDDGVFAGHRKFTAPSTRARKDGGVTLRYWYRSRVGGRRPDTVYTRVESVLSGKGEVKVKVLDHFVVKQEGAR